MKRAALTTLVICTIIGLENARLADSRKLISSTIKASSTEAPAAATDGGGGGVGWDLYKLNSTAEEPYKM